MAQQKETLSLHFTEAVGIALIGIQREETHMRSPAKYRRFRNFLHFSDDHFADAKLLTMTGGLRL